MYTRNCCQHKCARMERTERRRIVIHLIYFAIKCVFDICILQLWNFYYISSLPCRKMVLHVSFWSIFIVGSDFCWCCLCSVPPLFCIFIIVCTSTDYWFWCISYHIIAIASCIYIMRLHFWQICAPSLNPISQFNNATWTFKVWHGYAVV